MENKVVMGSVLPIKGTDQIGKLFGLKDTIPIFFKAKQIRKEQNDGGIGKALLDFTIQIVA